MKNRKRQIVGLAVAVLTAAIRVQAATWLNAVDGLYNDGSKWDTGLAPQAGTNGLFNKAGAYQVTFPAGGYTDRGTTEVSGYGTVTFDTTGTWWLKPANSVWGNPTFRMGGGAHGFNIEGANNAKAQLLLSNAVFKAFVSSTAMSNTLHAGLMNLYDPDGIDSGNTLVLGHDNTRKIYVAFEPGSSSRWKHINFRAKSSENIISINGGTHEVFGELNVADQTGPTTTGLVYLAGGELITRSVVRIGRSKTQLGRLVLATNGVWTAKYDPGIGSDGVGEVNLMGGTFYATNNTVNIGTGNAGTGTVNLISGRFCSTGYETRLGDNSTSAGRVTVSGGLMETKYFKCGNNGYGVANMTGGVWTNSGNATVGNYNGARGGMTISGGAFTSLDWLMVGSAATAIGNLTLAGGSTEFSDIMPGYNGGDGLVDVTGGINRFSRIRLGYAPCVRSLFQISGGTNTFFGNDGIIIGGQGKGEMIIDGGTVDSTQIRIGQNSNKTTAVSSLLINGGSTTLGTINVADNLNNAALLMLNGGVFAANQIRGWAGAAVKGGNGQALLQADGGTARARQNQTGFIQDFDSAQLGSSGLTIDTASFTVTIPQAFSNQTAISGRLLKVGAGTLTLSGANRHDNTVVAAGTLALSANDTLVNHVVVTNNGVLSLVGGATTLTLQTLTIGENTKPGWLSFDNTDTIVITQAAGLSLPFAKLTLLSPDTDGVYTLFTCAGNVPSSVLQNTEVSNPNLTKVYTLSAVYSSGTDTTDLKLTIQDKSSFVITERVWDGDTDSAWSTTGNWSDDTVPQAGEAALFTETPVNKTVTTVSGATAGILQFNASSSYTLGGAETLMLDNGGRFAEINATAGAHTVNAPLALPRTIIATEALNAGVTLAGPLSGNGGITKTGSGQLTLAAANSFKGITRVNGGRLTLGHAEAFGSAPADRENLVLQSGTLQYTGAPAAASRGFTLSADTPTSAVVLDVQEALSLSGQLWASAGVLVKRGPALLTLSVSGSDNKLSVGNGMTQDSDLLFPEGGDSPTDGYTGFTVAEGTVRISGSSDAVTRIENVATIGARTTQGTVSPALEIDGGTVYLGGGSMHTYIGAYTPAGSAMTNPALRVMNGATLNVNTLRFGYSTTGTALAPEFLVDNATVNAYWMVAFSDQASGMSSTILRNNSVLSTTANEIQAGNSFNVLVDNSLLTVLTLSSRLNFSGNASGTMLLQNNGRLAVPRIVMDSTKGVTLAFDNGIFQPTASGMMLFRNDNKHTVDIRNNGATFEVGNGLTYTVARPLTGVGGLTKTGAGTLVFGATLQDNMTSTNATGLIAGNYEGLTTVAAGTLAISNGTIRADAHVQVNAGSGVALNLSQGSVQMGSVSGNGTVMNGRLTAMLSPGTSSGTIDKLTIDSILFASGATNFLCDIEQEAEGSQILTNDIVAVTGTFSGNCSVNFNRTAETPLTIPFTVERLMTYNPANGTPDVSNWKVQPQGVGVSASNILGVFTASEGVISVHVRYSGTTIMFL